MGIVQRLFGKAGPSVPNTGYKLQMITENNGFYSWGGNVYKSDIVRSCIRPKAKAIGKLLAKHIRQTADEVKTNPDAYMRFLLEEPNPYMCGQMMQEKLATQLDLNNNAFALIVRDEWGYPMQLYPIPCVMTEAKYDAQGEIYLKFTFRNGKERVFPYRDIIHLRQDFNENDLFGDRPSETLMPLMEIVSTTDQGIVKAVRNGNIIRWLLKFATTLHEGDLKKNVDAFVKEYLSIDSDRGGAAGVNGNYDLVQVKPESYVPPAALMKETVQRIYSFFNTNSKIVQSQYTEDEWNAYYESEIEPLAAQMSAEYTRKLFSRTERSHGNKIIFEASNLQYASMSTKLNLREMVDRGAMTPNEWRWVMNMGPIEGGDKPIRRKDTGLAQEGGEDSGKNN